MNVTAGSCSTSVQYFASAWRSRVPDESPTAGFPDGA